MGFNGRLKFEYLCEVTHSFAITIPISNNKHSNITSCLQLPLLPFLLTSNMQFVEWVSPFQGAMRDTQPLRCTARFFLDSDE
jgi:hypothetical protein